MSIKKFLPVVFIASALLLLVGGSTQWTSIGAAQAPLAPDVTWTFEGQVWAGDVGDESHPLTGVTIAVYGANNPYPDLGTFIRSTTTNPDGRYSLPVYDDDGAYEFYHVVETNPSGYFSVGATTVGGTVRTDDWIEYIVPLDGKTLTDNKFWDRIPVLSGRVYKGDVGDEGQPLEGVTVSLYGGNNPHPEPGTLITSTTSDADGWYGLQIPPGYEFYHLRETDPVGYASSGATTVSGTVRTTDWIEYVVPWDGKTFTGNKFWDKPPIWDFVGHVLDEGDEPIPGLEVRLLGSATSGEAGALLDWTYTDEQGAYALYFEDVSDEAEGFPYFQIVTIRPGTELLEAISESGGETTAEGWLEFTQAVPGTFAGNIFKLQLFYQALGPPPLKLCAIADAWIGQDNLSANHGSDSLLNTGYITRQGAAAYRALARFDMSWVPTGTVVTDAEFQAYQVYAGGRDPVDVRAYRVQDSWAEGTVTWNNQPAVGGPATTAALGTGTGYQSWDVTQVVTGWLEGELNNYGLELRGPEEAPEWWRDFESRENTHPPRLVVHRGGTALLPLLLNPTEPYIVLTPDWGEAGTSFMVRGYNLEAAKTYDLYWDLPLAAHHLAQVTTDAQGTFGAQVTTPSSASAGIHSVLLYWMDPIEYIDRLIAQAPFTVEPPCWPTKPPTDLAPQITLSPVQGPSNGGNTVQVSGSGWSPNTTVKLYWDDPALCATTPSHCLGQVTTNAAGKFLASFTVPNVGGDEHLVIARNHPYAVPVQHAVAQYRMIEPPSPPANDDRPPTVFANHSIDHIYKGGPPISVYFDASAWDPRTTPTAYNGVVRVELWAWAIGGSYPPIHKTCQVNGWTPSLSCLHVENGPWGNNILGFFYYAQAEDRSGNVARSSIKFAWLINGGSDADNDGLSDAVENIICSDPQNPDSDRDNLLDGWEMDGYGFPGGGFVDLPSMGAHPCIPDVFVEIDWLPGQQPNLQNDLQPVINAYKDHGINLHIDTGQWGGGEQITSTQASIQNHFDPERLWSFHYTIFRPGGGLCWRGKVAFVGQGQRSQTFMHELGHCIGLGHGGMSGPDTQKRSGNAAQQSKWGFQWVWYDQDGVGMNNKANYLSLMSYAWNGLVWVPGTGFVFPHDYSEQVLPTLNENNLDERATSPFVQALRNYNPLPPGVPANGVVATMYSCLDPDDGNIYIMATDGQQLLARHLRGNSWPNWQTTNLPTQNAPGIDWDCDGTIESSVSTNINGCSGQCFLNHTQKGWQPGQTVTSWTPGEQLVGFDDWARIPSIDPCIGDGVLGAGFLKAAHDPPCEANGWAPNTSLIPPDDAPWTHVPPGEWCNGQDDDGDSLVDEGCADRDGDGVVDDLDNCPLMPNPQQEDDDQDLQGDVCETTPPPPDGLSADETTGGVQLTWAPVNHPGVVGYNVYRKVEGEETFRFLGATWPSTGDSAFLDQAKPASSATYQVRTVNRHGLESEPSGSAAWAPGGYLIYLPLVLK
jgi:hypothetical protein